VFVPGGFHAQAAPTIAARAMKRGAVIVDIDRRGRRRGARARRPTESTYVEEGVVHYRVANMPAAMPARALALPAAGPATCASWPASRSGARCAERGAARRRAVLAGAREPRRHRSRGRLPYTCAHRSRNPMTISSGASTPSCRNAPSVASRRLPPVCAGDRRGPGRHQPARREAVSRGAPCAPLGRGAKPPIPRMAPIAPAGGGGSTRRPARTPSASRRAPVDATSAPRSRYTVIADWYRCGCASRPARSTALPRAGGGAADADLSRQRHEPRAARPRPRRRRAMPSWPPTNEPGRREEFFRRPAALPDPKAVSTHAVRAAGSGRAGLAGDRQGAELATRSSSRSPTRPRIAASGPGWAPPSACIAARRRTSSRCRS
jgi:hypothetical protein